MTTYLHPIAPHSALRPEDIGGRRILPYLAGEIHAGYCTNCHAPAARRHLLYIPAVVSSRGIQASFQYKVCGACLSLTPHRPEF